MKTSVLTITVEECSTTIKECPIVYSIPYDKIDEICVLSNGVVRYESGAEIPLATIKINCTNNSSKWIKGEDLTVDLAVDYVNDIMAGLRAGLMVDVYVNGKTGISKVHFTDYPFDHKSYLGADACIGSWQNAEVK